MNDVRLAVDLASSNEFFARAPEGCGNIGRITNGDNDSYYPSVAGDTNGSSDVFLWNRSGGRTARITDGDDASNGSAVSGDGKVVAFFSKASNLVPDETTDKLNLFVWMGSAA